MREIVIIGAGDFGKELVWMIEDINKRNPSYIILGFLDDDCAKAGKRIHGYEVLGTPEELLKIRRDHEARAVIAMQDGVSRKKIVERLAGFEDWESVIHPTAVVSDTVYIGEGSIVCANVTISVDTVIGRHSLFYMSATVGNDCRIKDYVSIMSNASISEHVEIGEESYFAANSSIFPSTKVGKRVKVSVGAVVAKNLKDESMVSSGTAGLNFFK